MLSWVSSANLGSIETGFISEFSVLAEQSTSTSEIKYLLNSGVLPNGLSLKNDGSIAGKVSYASTGTFTFVVKAIDNVNNEQSTSTFNINVLGSITEKFTDVYFRPYLKLKKRSEYREFINDERIFNPKLLYRPQDINFGIQPQIKLVLDFGLEQLNLEEYLYALRENFYRKRLRLGGVKSLKAKDSNGNHIYDIVCVDVIDELKNADPVVYTTWNDEIYYPGSIENMRRQLHSITLRDYSWISVRNDLQPRYMLSQPPTESASNYLKVVPICYTLPGKSYLIVNKIKESGFKFNTIDFEIDRLIVSNSLDNNTAKYLIFDRQAVGDLLDLDSYLFGPEGWVRLDRENDEPLQRE
jgi:hypothetical protein